MTGNIGNHFSLRLIVEGALKQLGNSIKTAFRNNMQRIFCKCGCRRKVTLNRTYLVGHVRKGRKNSPKHNEGISIGQRAFYETSAGKQKKAKIRRVNSARLISQETRQKMSNTRRKLFDSVEGDILRKEIGERSVHWWASMSGDERNKRITLDVFYRSQR